MFSFVKAVLVILAFLVAFDIGAVLVCLVLEILPLEGVSTALFYAVWFVAGVFCALLSYNKVGGMLLKPAEGDWSGDPGSGKTGLIIIAITTLILVGFILLFQKLAWKNGSSSDPYVPDSIPLTLTFFITIFLSMVGGHFFLRPKPATKS